MTFFGINIFGKILQIFYATHQDYWDLSKELVADFKEVFMLFDKDEDGVLTFNELQQGEMIRILSFQSIHNIECR